jgi:acyl-CoA synthetase (AMP-forming)/AMP-acid ligase II
MFATVRLPLQSTIEVATTLRRRGLLRPERPDKVLRQGLLLWRWGTTIATAYAANAISQPQAVALADDEGELTWAEVHARTNGLARGLCYLGATDGGSVAILCRNGRGFVEGLVACAKVGADALLLNTSFSPGEVAALLEREKPAIALHDADLAELLEEGDPREQLTRMVTDGEPGSSDAPAAEALIGANDKSDLSPPSHESRPVVLTSGTTGTPKGARVARPSNLDPLAWFLRVVPIDARTPYLIAAPAFHAHGLGQLTAGSGLGCKLVLTRRFDPERTLALIEEHRVEAAAVVPVMLKRIMDLPPATRRHYRVDSLQVVLSSGSALPGDLALSFMREFGPVLYNLYGSTEVAWGTIATPDDLMAAPGTAGRAVPHTRVEILGEGDGALPAGETGRIFVSHEMLFEGYTDGTPSGERIKGMMTAGDLGHLDAAGRLFVDSRADDMIVSGGENVYPGEIEEALGAHPDVDEVAAVGVEDEQFGQRLVAFVVPRPGSELTAEQVDDFARHKLARFKVPRQVHLRQELPRNALGKVLKRELRSEAEHI